MCDFLTPLRVLRFSSVNAWADMWVMYSPLSWSLGWLGRVVMQVVFFATIALLLGSPDTMRFLYVGNAVMLTAMEVMFCVSSTTWERHQGTLPLLVAAPSRLWPVFVGRSVQWLPSGVATASVALFLIGPLFGLTWTAARAVLAFGCLLVVAVGTYCVGLALGTVVLAMTSMRNVVGNVAYTLMMLICGVMVPVAFWPTWVQAVAQAIPLTHALDAVRTLSETPAGHSIGAAVATDVVVALGAGAIWLLVAAFLMERLATTGRRTGSIEFAE